jgi:hypothetical protein
MEPVDLMAATVQIVDAVGSDRVLADLNSFTAGDAMLARKSHDLAAAAIDRAQERPFLWPQLAQPEELITRQISLPLVVATGSRADLSPAIARINNLTRGPWILKIVRHESTVPVWLRCYPTVPRWDANITSTGVALVTGQITADTEPYAYGQRIDLVPAEIGQDPANPTAWVMDVGNVMGDSVTPMCLTSADPNLLTNDHGLLLAVRHRGDPRALGPLVVQGEAFQNPVPLGKSPATIQQFTGDTAFSGSAGVAFTFTSTGTEESRGQVTFPSPFTGVEAPGQYRLLVRARRSLGSAGLEHIIRAGVGPVVLDGTFSPGGGDTRVIDLGLVQIPVGQPTSFASPAGAVAAAAPDVVVSTWRTSAGSGRLDVDWVALIPADEGQGVSFADAGGVPTGYYWHVDGYDNTPRIFNGHPFSPGAVAVGQLPTSGLRYVGGVPLLAPGFNRVWIIGGLSTGSVAWAPSKTIRVQVSYWPRYGWLG